MATPLRNAVRVVGGGPQATDRFAKRKTMGILEELKWRGLLHQTTGGEALIAHLATPGRVAYSGFDPTRPSLTIGNLIPLLLLRRWQLAGHKPVLLCGGATGLIGDPSGKDAERTLQSADQVAEHIAGQQRIMSRLVDFTGSTGPAAELVNNADWLSPMGYIEMLREVGKHFSVNAMIQRDSVRDRLENREQGISYTEFSYVLLQAYDFLHLYRTMNCTVQLSGSDQYGNIVSGIDLIRRLAPQTDGHVEAFGITAPLVTGADGKKIGKTEKGAIWLSPEDTSPYAFYQFWINCTDADVSNFLKWYTLLSEPEITEILSDHEQDPGRRNAQRRLAEEATTLVHGEAELRNVQQASAALFGGDIRGLSAGMLDQVFADVPSSNHAVDSLGGDGVPLLSLLPETSLASSKREARQFLERGAVAVNGQKVDLDKRLTSADLLHGGSILLRRGKKLWHATRWK